MSKRSSLEIGRLSTFQTRVMLELERSSKMRSPSLDPRSIDSMINNGRREELENSKFSSTKIAAKLDYFAEEKRLINAFLITMP